MSKDFVSKTKNIFKKGNKTKLVISKKGEIIASIPVTYLILAALLAFQLVLITLLIVLIVGCKISIKKCGEIEICHDDVIEVVGEKVDEK